MNIEQLPVEMLMKIFSFLPTYNEVSLVSKLFYAIACDVNESTICLRINRLSFKRFISNDPMDFTCIQSLQASIRKISKLQLSACRTGRLDGVFGNKELRQIIPIIEKFSPTIKLFKCEHLYTDEPTLLRIISSTPNVKHLELKDLHPDYRVLNGTEDNSTHSQHFNDDLNLEKLESMSIDEADQFAVFIINRLSAGILTELRVSNFCWHNLNSVLRRQLNIKQLKLEDGRDNVVDMNIFDKLQLDSLEVGCAMTQGQLATILSKQKKLKSINVFGISDVNEQVMEAVANLLALEKLTIRLADVSLEYFVKLKNLKKLTDFTLLCDSNGDNLAILETFASWNNISIVKLSLDQYIKIPVSLIHAISKTVPHLKHLKLTTPNLLCRTMETDAFMSHFNFIDVLEIPINGEPDGEGDYFNSNLRELKVVFDGLYHELWLPKLMASYPNLRKLKMEVLVNVMAQVRIVSLKIRSILSGFPKLESLTIAVPELIVVDLDYLQDHKHNLKFVSIGRLEEGTFTNELVKRIRANFGVLNVNDCNWLTVAVDRYTMNCECEVNCFNFHRSF